MKKTKVFLPILFLLALIFSAGAEPPSPHNVKGFIFHANGTGVDNGIPVLINDTTQNTSTTTEVFAPPIPQLRGAYSATISGVNGDTIVVYAWNGTQFGSNTGTLGSTTEINVTVNTNRTPEPNVTIVSPLDDTLHEHGSLLNITVNVTVLGADGNCSVTLSFGNASVINITPGETYTHELGIVNREDTFQTNYSVNATELGNTNITANASCTPAGIILEARTIHTLQNITVEDTTPPNVTLLSPPDFDEQGRGLVNFSYRPFDFNLDSCILYFGKDGDFDPNETDSSPLNEQTNTFEDLYFEVGVYVWNVWCNDTEGNAAFAPANFTLNVTPPDLSINTSSIWFSNEPRIEDTNITIFANVTNIGLSDLITEVSVQFWLGNPSAGGTQINGNRTISSLAASASITLNVTHLLQVGNNEIFVTVDPDDRANETREDNNNATNNITTELYNYYYGNISTDVLLDTGANESFISFNDILGLNGTILITDSDSAFSFADMHPLGRDVNNNSVANDFNDTDINLNITTFNDSVRIIWTAATDSPLATYNFTIGGREIQNVPVVNTTNSSTFITGILWDTDDDLSVNLQFDTTDEEDLIFVTNINPGQIGLYGTYDYEIRVPSRLKEYKGSDPTVSFYYEIQ